jgi:hypothetical protein
MSWRTNRRTGNRFMTRSVMPKGRLQKLEGGWEWRGSGKSGRLTVGLNKFLGIFGLENQSPDKLSDYAYENPPDIDYSEMEKELEEQGLSPDQIQEKIQEAEDAQISEGIREQENNVESAIEQYLTSHPIRGIRSVNIDWGAEEVNIDVDDLDELLTSERQVMNGVGMFEAGSNEELIRTSGHSKVGVVASHFGWLSSAAEVYGTSSIQRILDRRY